MTFSDSKKDGLAVYRKHHLYAVLLESLASKQYCQAENLFGTISTHISEEIKWNATMTDINRAVIYLIFIGMIEVREDNAIRITGKGMDALADCRFQQLATSTFFEYRSMKNTETGLIFAVFSFIVSLVALVISIF